MRLGIVPRLTRKTHMSSTTAPPDPFRPGVILAVFAKYASKSALPALNRLLKALQSPIEKPITKDLKTSYKWDIDYPW